YHALAQCLLLYAVLLLFHLADDSHSIKTAAALGVLGGLAFVTRLNDGAAQLAAIGACIFFLVPRGRVVPNIAAMLAYVAAAASAVFLAVSLTGDTFAEYVFRS